MPYATRADLREECEGIELSRLGDGATVEGILDTELDRADLWAENMTLRRAGAFNNNTSASISVDGTGLPVLLLARYGYVPIISVAAISIDDAAQTLTDFVIYDTHIEFGWSGADVSATTQTAVSYFTPGSENIDVTLNWGYAAVPELVNAAVVLRAKGRLLRRISMARDPTDAAVPPGVVRYQAGEFSVQFDSRGQYGPQIKACDCDALDCLKSFILETVTAPRGRRGYRGFDTSDAALAHYRTDA